MDTVVVLELDIPTNIRILGPDHMPADPENPVRRVHAAPLEPSGACGPLTLCGLDTSEMTLAPYRLADTDEPTLRSHWHACSTCRTARRSPAPTATAPTTAEPAADARTHSAQAAETATR
ncbi:hypothetical protein [Kitasatospora sp. NPDC050463]|uniref:hypothetical protein n=1 Tax=Kitasatospora sp. NPDC050463 TaxID=3155786 RepID=UPI0033CB9377